MADETGMFDSITDEEIKANAGKTYQDVTALRDPLAGLGYGEEEVGPFKAGAWDSLTLDYPGQPRAKNGQFSQGKMLTGGGRSGILKSSKKVIGKNGGTLRAEDLPNIRITNGTCGVAKANTQVTRIYTFAGAGAKTPLRLESSLIQKYGGKAGQWQHTTGDVEVVIHGASRVAEVHWFQEPSVGIVGAKVKRWR